MTRYNDLVFRATHNSYAGAPSGDLGSLRRQLDRGVRFLELDVHDNEFASAGYRIGHESPGSGVVHAGGNPRSDRLGAWLQTIARWSVGNSRHAPITLALDLKDRLTDNRSFAQGNLARLNQELLEAFGPRLFTAEQLPGGRWPTLEALRGRLIVVLSGDQWTRLAYLRDPGHNPAVAVNSTGRVVEVHDSGGGELWYWTGEFASPGRLLWHRHGRYDTGQRPAVARNDAGFLVEVHEDPDPGDDRLWYRVGRLTSDLEIDWLSQAGRGFPGADQGVSPSIRFVDRASELVREVHESPSSGLHWYWNGSLDVASRAVAWSRAEADEGQTSDPLFDKARDGAARRKLAVRTGFNERRYATDPPVSFPATDHPATKWYEHYCAGVGAVS